MTTEAKRIFISGPMAGIKDYNFPLFDHTEQILRGYGHQVVNPANTSRKYVVEKVESDKTVYDAMVNEELDELRKCTAILLLNGWEKSVGARRELKVALECNLEILFTKDIWCLKVEGRNAVERGKKLIAERTEKLHRELDGMNVCEWASKVPRNRRFALCYKVEKKFNGWSESLRNDPNYWEDIPQYCAIDLIRGYTGPYWGYFSGSDSANRTYRERLSSLMKLEGEEYYKNISCNFDFFRIEGADLKTEFSIVDYSVDDKDEIHINGFGDRKTLQQHFEDLKTEFGN